MASSARAGPSRPPSRIRQTGAPGFFSRALAKAVHTPETAHTPGAQAWLSQGDAARRLAEHGDPVSRTALVRWLANHAEVPTRCEGPGKPVFVDFDALLVARQAQRKSEPASQNPRPAAAPAVPPKSAEFIERQRQAQLDREEQQARLARHRADEAEGKTVRRDDAVAAFRAIAAVIVQSFDARRRKTVLRIRAAADTRAAEIIMREEEDALRRLIAAEAAKLLPEASAPPAPAAAPLAEAAA